MASFSSGSSDDSDDDDDDMIGNGNGNGKVHFDGKSSVDNNGEENDIFVEVCHEAGTKTTLRPLGRAPKNVFEFKKSTSRETIDVEKSGSSTITTKTSILTTSKGWRNIFTLPISYDVNMVPAGTILEPSNLQLLESTG